MPRKKAKCARATAARKRWLEKADQWDGQAYVYDPVRRVNTPADWYQRQIAEPMMHWFDKLHISERRRIADSVDGF